MFGKCVVVALGMLLVLANGVVADIPLGIESYPAVVDRLTQEVKVSGQKIVHRDFDVQLEDVILRVPIFSLQEPGFDHAVGLGENRAEPRAKGVVERLTIALDLMDQGGTLVIRDDDWNLWRIKPQTAPPTAPAIFVVHPVLRQVPLRIITIYPEDQDAFPGVSSQRDMAEYVVALIQAHHLLFWKKSTDVAEYENLRVDKTREGKIFKEIMIRAKEMMVLKKVDVMTDEILKDAMARMAMQQRGRLVRMAFKAPIDWQHSP